MLTEKSQQQGFQLIYHVIYQVIADTTTIMPCGLPKGPSGREPPEQDTREAPHEEMKDNLKGRKLEDEIRKTLNLRSST